MPGSRFKTGALFPGRYCIPFSFDDDHKSRHRHDQLSVICRVLSPPIKEEMAWADEAAQKEVSKICGGFREMDGAARDAEVLKRASDACPIASEAELSLLVKMLAINPTKRPSAKGCMEDSAPTCGPNRPRADARLPICSSRGPAPRRHSVLR